MKNHTACNDIEDIRGALSNTWLLSNRFNLVWVHIKATDDNILIGGLLGEECRLKYDRHSVICNAGPEIVSCRGRKL